MRIQLDQRLRPEATTCIKPIDLTLDFGGTNPGEGARKSLILLKEMLV
jgi:hypothetical protein